MTSFTLLHFTWNRTNHCGETCRQLMSQVSWGKTGNRLRWSKLMVDPKIRLPGFDLHQRQWSLLNRFWTGQGHCNACHKKWGFTNNELCDCGEIQTMSLIINSCPLTKFDGGLLRLHEVDEAAVDWCWQHRLLAHNNNNNTVPQKFAYVAVFTKCIRIVLTS